MHTPVNCRTTSTTTVGCSSRPSTDPGRSGHRPHPPADLAEADIGKPGSAILVIGNGMSSNDVSDGSFQKSVTAAVHIAGKQMRVNLSFYSDIIYGNMVGAHSGHAGGSRTPWETRLARWTSTIGCTASACGRGKWEVLFEGTFNQTGLAGATTPISSSGFPPNGPPTPRCSSSPVTRWASGDSFMLATGAAPRRRPPHQINDRLLSSMAT